ncbi:RteC domain-containing protein [Aequorivita sp. 609]|uniref:RteC domain-containing protein n=1 Tax=Aequorivita TaxID=153265 RepID=UPI00160AD5AC|nr:MULTISPECIES: RteC domain-containing protein [Aequorivita]MBB6681220.1 RteC domain-containing protein [Aequorivita sp. 609]
MKNCRKIVADLEQKIVTLNSGSTSVFEEVETGMYFCRKAINKLRKRFLSIELLSPDQECYFFKTIKPIPAGYMIYFISLADFELNRPQTSNRKIKKYIQEKIASYQEYFVEHRTFYKYLERRRTDRDSEYFLRSNGKVKFHLDAVHYCIDQNFSTSHDYITAKIFAHKLLISRLRKELFKLKNTSRLNTFLTTTSSLQWTANKVDLIELIYALHAVKSINNGQVEIKDIASIVQEAFNIELGDYYRTFIEIRSRKIHPTKFLDNLKQSLTNRILQADE